MKKISLLFVSLLCSVLMAHAQESAQGIKFVEGTLQDALQLAQKQNKPVFVDFYAKWCVPCKRMAKTIFTLDSVGAYFNDKFISIQLDAEAPENVAVAKQYKVEAFPTLGFLKPDGKSLSITIGAMTAPQLMEAARVAAGDMISFEQLYDKYKANNSDLALQQQLLLKAPSFLSAQEGMDGEKWAVRLRKLYRNYIAAKKGDQLINKKDYIIINTLGGDDKTEMITEFNNNLAKWKAAVGDPVCYYIVENNDAMMEKLAKEGKDDYKACVEKIKNEYQEAYKVVDFGALTAYDRAKIYYASLYDLYKNKDTKTYMKQMADLFTQLADKAAPSDYAKAAQDLYYAAGNKVSADEHRLAITWVEKALGDENSVMDRINYLVMIGDSYRELKDFAKAREYYNQGYAESLQMGKMEMAQQMLQAAITQKLARLELLEK